MKLVILVGQAGVGKTTIRDLLAERLDALPVGPDDFPNRWDDIYWRLDTYPCVLECCGIPAAVRKRLTGDETIVELYASEEVRRARLQQQGHDARTIAERLGQGNGSLGYRDTIIPDLRLDTTGPSGPLADRIAELCAGQPGTTRTILTLRS